MPLLPFLHRSRTTMPLTQERMHQVLKAVHCKVSYRFELVLAVDATGQEYFVCREVQLVTMTAQQFREALALALSFRVGKSS